MQFNSSFEHHMISFQIQNLNQTLSCQNSKICTGYVDRNHAETFLNYIVPFHEIYLCRPFTILEWKEFLLTFVGKHTPFEDAINEIKIYNFHHMGVNEENVSLLTFFSLYPIYYDKEKKLKANLDLVSMLVNEFGACINCCFDSTNFTTLQMVYLYSSDDENMLELLIQLGGDINDIRNCITL